MNVRQNRMKIIGHSICGVIMSAIAIAPYIGWNLIWKDMNPFVTGSGTIAFMVSAGFVMCFYLFFGTFALLAFGNAVEAGLPDQ